MPNPNDGEHDARNDDESDNDDDLDTKTARARQLLHWATGDREREAQALADQAGEDVTEDDAEAAVGRAHGERRDRPPVSNSELADVEDAEAAAAESD